MPTFDADAVIAEFRECFRKRLEKIAEHLAKEMVNSMNGGTTAERLFKNDVKNFVTHKVMNKNSTWNVMAGIMDAPEQIYFKAFIMAFGSGNYIDRESNEWFDQYYKGSYNGCKYWNTIRDTKGGSITFRPLGERYYDFFIDDYRIGHGPNKNGEYHRLPFHGLEGDAWFQNAKEKCGFEKIEYIGKKLKEAEADCLRQNSVFPYFK